MKSNDSSFTIFFREFPRLLLAGLLFSIPCSAFMALSVFVSYITGFNNVILWSAGIVPSTLFLSGLVAVIRKYAAERTPVPVASTFFSAVKSNLKQFLFHGIALYLIFICSFYAIIYYFSLASQDMTFGYILTLYVLFSLVLLMAFFYVPMMTVTYELKLFDIYRNSFIIMFGKIIRSLLVLVLVLLVVGTALSMLIFSEGVLFWIALTLVSALCPLIIEYITVSFTAKPLKTYVGDFTKKDVSPEETDDFADAPVESAPEDFNSTDDYIFVGGKMIKNPNK